MYSLLALMFEKCELATCTPRDPKIRDDICTSQTLDDDFNEFSKQVRIKQIKENFSYLIYVKKSKNLHFYLQFAFKLTFFFFHFFCICLLSLQFLRISISLIL